MLADGRIVLCDGNVGELLEYADGQTTTFARTGGSPWGTVVGTDGAIYVTQGGNVPGSGDTRAVCGIQRVRADGTVEIAPRLSWLNDLLAVATRTGIGGLPGSPETARSVAAGWAWVTITMSAEGRNTTDVTTPIRSSRPAPP